MKNYHGTIYLNNGRYWWKVRLPGQTKQNYIALKSTGARFATKDFKTAKMVAAELWQEHLRKRKAEVWDGKLITLVQMYNAHNEAYYLPPSKEAYRISHAIFPLAEYYPDLLADDFGPLHLKNFREFIVNGEKYDWCRKLINERIRCIKRMFKWAASETLVSVHTYMALTTVEGLRKGRTIARESKKVLPADMSMVNAIIARVTPVLADMIQIQLYTGMRPGELCKMRPCDIDRSTNIWQYIPKSHKTDYLNYNKIVLIGPKAQKILSKYLFRPSTEYCFKPADSDSQARSRRRESRKTPLSCGNRAGTNRKNTQKFNECYDTRVYRQAIQRACVKANVEHWHPHQLRHTAATMIRKKFGLDAARAVLGHKSPAITEVYAELDLQKAEKAVMIVG
jgi:integrase